MTWTKEQHAVYHKAWTERNRDKRRAANERWRISQRDWFKALKETLACERCGESHIACLEFHHKDPKKKEKALCLVANNWGKKRLLAEIAKCEVLCSNCHRKHHYALKHARVA